MRKIVAAEFLTLDGVMQAPGGEKEDTEGGFEFGGWQMKYGDAAFGEIITELHASSDALLLGRKTYDIFSAFWPTATEDMEIAKQFNAWPKYVASKTLDTLTWENSHLLGSDIKAELLKLKETEGKNILVWGSGDFMQTLMKENLVDEYLLMIHPITLGKGKKLFREGGPKLNLKLIDSKSATTGVQILRYIPETSK
jgi:dihydrofolate reductase